MCRKKSEIDCNSSYLLKLALVLILMGVLHFRAWLFTCSRFKRWFPSLELNFFSVISTMTKGWDQAPAPEIRGTCPQPLDHAENVPVLPKYPGGYLLGLCKMSPRIQLLQPFWSSAKIWHYFVNGIDVFTY